MNAQNLPADVTANDIPDSPNVPVARYEDWAFENEAKATAIDDRYLDSFGHDILADIGDAGDDPYKLLGVAKKIRDTLRGFRDSAVAAELNG